MWSSWRQRFQSAVRYKLLALVLLPLSAAMAVTLGYTLYWFHGYTQESLNVTLRDHLAAARQALHQFQHERQTELQQLAESAQFRALLRQQDRAAIQRTLRQLRDTGGYAFAHITGVAGNWLFEESDTPRASKPSPLTDRAVRGFSGAAFEVFRDEHLRLESIRLEPADADDPSGREYEERGLMLRFAQPITDQHGRVSMVLDAGVLLNRNHKTLHNVSNRVFTPGLLPASAEPMVTLLLDGRRIAAAGSGWSNLTGTRLPPELHASLREKSELSIGHEQLGRQAYVSAYGPLYDVNGQQAGVLQIGVRESAFRANYYRAAALLLSLFLLATAVAAWVAVRGVRSVFRPIESMAGVVRAIQAGDERRIGPIGTRDEIGELARQFDTMLDQLAARNREIQRAATALELKVAARTQELAHKNAELQQTIALLEKTQEQLVLADKLSALGQMAAGIAHEINNPAAVILGNLDVLSTELGPAAQPVAREIELIAQQVERIRHIVNSLLQFARARPGASPIVEISVNHLVQDVLPLVAHMLKVKAIDLRHRLEAKGTVAINPFDLEQVLVNLIVNAANACDPGGVIEITTGDRPEGAVISVRDNGCGIPRSVLKRIFDPFFTTDLRRGAGLGLSVSYGLVRRYGGSITVRSEVGKGSVFRVWLLRKPEIATPEATPETTRITENNEANYG